MLVLLSDLHLTDETTANNIDPDSLDLRCNQVAHSARKPGVKRVRVVLLGDVFDLVRTSYWLERRREERPWNSADGKLGPYGSNPGEDKVEEHVGVVLDRILAVEATQKLFAMLHRLAEDAGRPVEISYVVGNHDRMLLDFPRVAARLWEKFPKGLAPAQSLEIRDPAHSLLARHGHQWDEHNHDFAFGKDVLGLKGLGRFDAKAHRVLTIGEVVTAELMSGILHRLREAFPQKKHRPFLAAMKDLNNLRPAMAVFEWITWLAEDGRLADRYVEALGAALRDSLEAVVESDLARQWDRLKISLLVRGDLVDRLQEALFVLGEKGNLKRLRRFLPQAYGLVRLAARFGDDLDQLAEGAAQDFEDEDASIQFLAYGHSHHARRDWFQGSRDGQVRLYVNTGTFLPLVERAHRGNGFCQAERLTYAMVFEKGEAGGKRPSIDVWDGVRRGR